LQWIKDLNIRHETLKLLEENIDEIFDDTHTGNKILNRTPVTQEIKELTIEIASTLKTPVQPRVPSPPFHHLIHKVYKNTLHRSTSLAVYICHLGPNYCPVFWHSDSSFLTLVFLAPLLSATSHSQHSCQSSI
jgi:hypothetical protein